MGSNAAIRNAIKRGKNLLDDELGILDSFIADSIGIYGLHYDVASNSKVACA